MKKPLITLTLAAIANAALFGAAPQTFKMIKAARLLNVKDGTYLSPAMVLVEGERIKAVATTLPVPEGAEVIDLGGATLLPGLIDCHTHLLMDMDPKLSEANNFLFMLTTMSTADRVLLGAAKAREMVEAGFTSVREAGNCGKDGDIALRAAINKGLVQGPRIMASTRAISGLGAQISTLTEEARHLVGTEYIEVTSPEEARRAVRSALAAWADCIKVILSHGPRNFGLETLKAIVTEAHGSKKTVLAHAGNAFQADMAIEAGVDSLEHGYILTDDQLKRMASKNIYLVPTDFTMAFHLLNESKAGQEARLETFTGNNRKRMLKAIELKVKIAAGSDSYWRIPGFTRGQASKIMFSAYRDSGMPALEIIKAATVNAAELMGWSDRVGSLDAGKFADLVAVAGDPTVNIQELEKISFVMKGGVVIKN